MTALDAVAEMDLAAFHGAYRADGHGRPAYDPQMMVALLLCAGEHHTRSRGHWHGLSVATPDSGA